MRSLSLCTGFLASLHKVGFLGIFIKRSSGVKSRHHRTSHAMVLLLSVIMWCALSYHIHLQLSDKSASNWPGYRADKTGTSSCWKNCLIPSISQIITIMALIIHQFPIYGKMYTYNVQGTKCLCRSEREAHTLLDSDDTI